MAPPSSQRTPDMVEVEPAPAGRPTGDGARRAEAVKQARASLRLEGLDVNDPAATTIMERWVRGELTGDQAVEEMARLPLS